MNVPDMDKCVLCPKDKSDIVPDKSVTTLGTKGAFNINKISSETSDGVKVQAGQKVHIFCRKNYTRPTNNNKKESRNVGDQLILEAEACSLSQNDIRNVCMFCLEPAKLTECRKRGIDAHQVKDKDFETTIRECILTRDDKWAHEVEERIRNKNLIGTTYHQQCSVNFRLSKPLPSDSNKKIGRPQDKCRDAVFLKICGYMEANEGKVFSLSELCEKMQLLCDKDVVPYSYTYLKQRLSEHFGDKIVFSQMSGNKTLVLFRYLVDYVISDFYKSKREMNSEAEKKRIIQDAARLTLSDILSTSTSKEEYPNPEDLSSVEKQLSFISPLLSEYLMGIIKSKNRTLKIVGIGHAITQAARPRGIISPVQIGLGIQMHHHFASKFLINALNKLGFSSSYTEVKKFNLCAAAFSTNEDDQDNTNNTKQVVKFVADNVDHDTRTLDGKNTFHGMGMIAAFTPGISKRKAVERAPASIDNVRAIANIPIQPYEWSTTENKLIYEKIKDLGDIDSQEKIDFLLSITWGKQLRPSWAGVMQSLIRGTHSGKSSIKILPMIDLNPSDFTCIYSTLLYVADQAKKYGVPPVVTFDSPLLWKAQIIIQNAPEDSPIKNIVLLLGGFHTVMSFLGCIGTLMEEMGLQETLETIYARNSVTHMLTGKSYSRALRGHFIVDNALNTLLTREIVAQVLNDENAEENDWNQILTEVDALFEKMMNRDVPIDEVTLNKTLNSAKDKFERVKQRLSKDFRTARLWLQYTEMIQLLRSFIRSERTGNWSLNLSTLRKMLPYFAAAGHNHYAKCVYIYLQQMLQLKTTHPVVYNNFSNGDFIIRRSERYWGGTACDLTIEQGLMRCIKGQGGMTRGRGIDEKQRLIWVHSMPDRIEINNAMQELTGLHFETSEQHKDCGASRQKRDHDDTQRVLEFLKERNPFQREYPELCNICNGFKADSNVNVDDAARIGEKIISSMVGKNVENYTFKKANSVIKVNSKNALVVDGEIVTIDPQLLFQRLILITKDMDEEQLRNVFKYELSQKPSALFDEVGCLREANNFTLCDTLWKQVGPSMSNAIPFQDCHYIVNGSSLINSIPWQKNEAFDDICSKYLKSVSQYDRPTVVFESSYDLSPSIKDEIHLRRTKGIPGKDILFTGNMLLNCKKETLLFNRSNMQRFINLLGQVLHENNCSVIYASDPVATIAEIAVRSAITRETVVVGGDVNTLVVLCNRYGMDSHGIWFKADKIKKCAARSWNIRTMDEILGRQIMKSLIFIHAVTGSEGTSHLFGLGAATALTKFKNLKALREVSEVFIDDQSKIPEIVEAGNKAVCILYNGPVHQALNTLRYQRFLEKVASKTTAVQVESLPPTEAAARYHSLRTYYQIQTWIGQTSLDPLQFGWELRGNVIRAKTTDLDPAPPEILSCIRCNCGGSCNNMRCSCKKHGLKCTQACGECKGSYCLNTTKIIVDDDDTDDENDNDDNDENE